MMDGFRPDLDRARALGIDWCLAREALPGLADGRPGLAFAGEATGADVDFAAWKLGLVPHGHPVLEGRDEDLQHGLAVLRGEQAAAGDGLLGALREDELVVGEGSTLEEIRRKSQAEPVVRLVDHVLDEALRLGATDVHLEPDESGVAVRLRRDGMLREFLSLPRWVQASLVSRVKILAELDIAERRLPQDGRIQRQWRGEELDVRVSTLPVRSGEKLVLRLLRRTAEVLDLPQVGMPDGIRGEFEALCDRPQGMIFVTGPTGSGKSSTLHAALRRLLPRDINVTTIEDPVEYRLPRANQVQINERAGLGFPEALRSILRQDPDVVLVGEIRDPETAAIAVQAAQTGHLVFSTLHTNDAPGAVTRLVDLGVPRFLVASAVLGVAGQRLVRRLCPACRQWAPRSEFDLAPFAAWDGPWPDLLPRSVGCTACEGTGYRGRTGVFELLRLDESLRATISAGADEFELRRLSGMRPLLFDALEKVFAGVTTLDETARTALR